MVTPGARGGGGGLGGRPGLSGFVPLPQHHTTGVNCELCLPGFYRSPDHPLDSPHTCRREWGQPAWGTLGVVLTRSRGGGDPMALGWGSHGCLAPLPPSGCDCQSEFMDGTCEDLTGRCYCRRNFTGDRCEECAAGFTGFPHCHREAPVGRGGGAGALLSCPPPPTPGLRG